MGSPQIIERLGRLTPEKIRQFAGSLRPEEAQALIDYWPIWALPHQQMPEGDWRRWNMRVGRGGGKTFAGAKWVNHIAEDRSKIRRGEIGLVAKTFNNVRYTMIEDPGSGILATAKPGFRPIWEPGNGLLTWPNGVRGRVVSADRPDTGRGLNAALFWADEIMAWPKPEEMYWEIIEPALRIGWARCIITSTPKPKKFLRDLEALPDTVVTRGSTYDNVHLQDKVKLALKQNFEGTRRGLQELYGEILEDSEAFLWDLDTIHAHRVSDTPDLKRIVVAIDPAATDGDDSDETGIVVCGIDEDGDGYVLEDCTLKGRPEEWAKKAHQMYRFYQADCICAEVNNGGQMVESVIRAVDRKVSYKSVRATRGKVMRAEPVSALYELGRVHHVGTKGLEKLEHQMTNWQPGQKSPDRMDALVWGITELMLGDEDGVGSLLAYT
jgi:phage terminase large subunit-like protein